MRRDECVAEHYADPVYAVYHPDIEPGFLLMHPRCRAWALVAPLGRGDYAAYEVVDASPSAPRRLVEDGVVLVATPLALLYAYSRDARILYTTLRVCWEKRCDARLVQRVAAAMTVEVLSRIGDIDVEELAARVEKLVFMALYTRSEGGGLRLRSNPPNTDYVIGFTGPESGLARLTAYALVFTRDVEALLRLL